MTNAGFYMKDDRKRISELNSMVENGEHPYDIVGERCRGICGEKHQSHVYMRKLVKSPNLTPKPKTKVEFKEVDGQRVAFISNQKL